MAKNKRLTFSVYLTEAERVAFDQQAHKESMRLSHWIKKQMQSEALLDYTFPLAKYQERFEMQLEPELKLQLELEAKSYHLSMTEYVRFRCWGRINATNH